MSWNKTAAVVVPVYKSDMTRNEELSFRQCINVLRAHDIILIGPEGLEIDNYVYIKKDIICYRFNRDYFYGIQGYNRLMLSKEFYKRFIDYKYILIYQLDAFVFSDQLDEWCARGYDYIGAPWVDLPSIDDIASTSTRLSRCLPRIAKYFNEGVGNGGFSLRKVRSFLYALTIWEGRAKTWPYYEDTFWAFFVSVYNPFFRVPSFKDALRFSFEHSPAKCYLDNANQLPFGCHAWEKYDMHFWRPIFHRLGHEI